MSANHAIAPAPPTVGPETAKPEIPQAGETIAVAMSGGVDSSAVAALLRAQGHTLVGLTLQLWNQRRLAGHEGMPESVQGRCCSIDDVYDARRVAKHLDIPYYLVNQEARFEAEVVKPSSPSTSLAARPSPARSATTTSSSTRFCSPHARSAPTASPPDTTRATTSIPSAIAGSSLVLPTIRRTRPTSSSASRKTS